MGAVLRAAMAARDHRPVRASTRRGGGLTLTGVGVAEAAEAVDGRGHAPEALASMEAAADDARPPSRHLWTSRSADVTCLSFGLNPLNLLDKKITCTSCCNFFDTTLRSNIANLSIGKNSKRSEFGLPLKRAEQSRVIRTPRATARRSKCLAVRRAIPRRRGVSMRRESPRTRRQ